jgi:hypothetical protein
MRAKELKDIRFGNTKTKVVSFHKGQNDIHEPEREKCTSIVKNLRLSKKGFLKGENPFAAPPVEKSIFLDSETLVKIGQVSTNQALKQV